MDIEEYTQQLRHLFTTHDPARVYAHLQYGLDDFERFISYIYEFLRREGHLEE